jgi:hypothetical protein
MGIPSTSQRRLSESRLVETWAFSILLSMPWLMPAMRATSAIFRPWAWRCRLSWMPRYCSSFRRGSLSVDLVM